jgi:hypothetical protein
LNSKASIYELHPADFNSATGTNKPPPVNIRNQLHRRASEQVSVDRKRNSGVDLSPNVSQTMEKINRDSIKFCYQPKIGNISLPKSLKPGYSPYKNRGSNLVEALKSSRKRHELNEISKNYSYRPEIYGDNAHKNIISP